MSKYNRMRLPQSHYMLAIVITNIFAGRFVTFIISYHFIFFHLGLNDEENPTLKYFHEVQTDELFNPEDPLKCVIEFCS